MREQKKTRSQGWWPQDSQLCPYLNLSPSLLDRERNAFLRLEPPALWDLFAMVAELRAQMSY